MSELTIFLTTTGRTLAQMALYSPGHPTVKDTISECHRLLSMILAGVPELTLSLSENKLLVNGKSPEGVQGTSLRTFVQFFNTFDLYSLTFLPGVREQELIPFFLLAYRNDFRNSKPDVAAFLSSNKVDNIKVNQAKYAKIGEDEEVGKDQPSGTGKEEGAGTGDGAFLQELQDLPLDSFLAKLVKKAVTDPGVQSSVLQRVTSLIKKEMEKAVERETRLLRGEKVKATNERERTESVVENMADGVVVVDPNGHVLMMNTAAEQIYGVSLGECLGKPLWEGVREEQMVALAKDLAVPMDRSLIKEVEVKAKEDTKKTLRASAAAIQDTDGRVVGMISVLSDVSKQKELTRLQNEFVANVTHDLRTPIHAVKLAVEAILENAAGPVTTEQKRMLSVATRNVDRLSRLIDNLLDFSQIEAGKFKIRAQVIEIGPLLGEAVASLEAWSKSRGVSISYEELEALSPVYADPDRILQVVNNLVSNGIKFTPIGGRIFIRAKNINDGGKKKVRIEVEDTGKGIALEDQKRIFDRFVQLKNDEKLDVRGTGLGLSICQAIILEHNSRLNLESPVSNKKQGTLFWFNLTGMEKTAMGRPSVTLEKSGEKVKSKRGFWSRLIEKFKLSLYVIFLFTIVAEARPHWGRVRRVVEGNQLQLEDGSLVKYLGIDFPAKASPYYAEAVSANKSLVEKKEVELQYGLQERDTQGIWQAYVFVDGIFINEVLVQDGLALVSRLSNEEDYLRDLIQAERNAHRSKRGMWRDTVIEPYPVRSQKSKNPPWASEEEIRSGIKSDTAPFTGVGKN